jgi:hypothetical protein
VGQITKPQLPILSSKLGETVDLGFKAKSRKPRSSSPCAWCRLHTVSLDLSITRPLSTQHVLDRPGPLHQVSYSCRRSSSLPAMLHLSPTRHETSNRVSPHRTYSWVEPQKFPRFKFKPRQVNYSSQIKQGTDHMVSRYVDARPVQQKPRK